MSRTHFTFKSHWFDMALPLRRRTRTLPSKFMPNSQVLEQLLLLARFQLSSRKTSMFIVRHLPFIFNHRRRWKCDTSLFPRNTFSLWSCVAHFCQWIFIWYHPSWSTNELHFPDPHAPAERESICQSLSTRERERGRIKYSNHQLVCDIEQV